MNLKREIGEAWRKAKAEAKREEREAPRREKKHPPYNHARRS